MRRVAFRKRLVRKMKKGAFTSEENPKLYKYLERGKGTVCHQ